MIITMNWGLPASSPPSPARAVARSRATDGCQASHGARTRAATIVASTADSWSVSTAAPSTAPRMMARRRPGWRRSRTAASRAIGWNSAPRARFTSYQLRQVRIADRPKKPPAAIAPRWVGSQSRAARYIT
jgi:hypothetical protein